MTSCWPIVSAIDISGWGLSKCVLHKNQLGLFTKERITFWKPFPITIHFLIGFVIWAMCIHKHWNRRAVPITNRICTLQGNILFLLRWLTCAWLQCAFPKCTCTYHVSKEICVHKSSESGFLGRSQSKRPYFLCSKSLIWNPHLKELCIHKG